MSFATELERHVERLGISGALDGITPLPEPLLWLTHEQEGSL